ncbi:MAG: DUF4465 domain-containing protein, partial [Pirellulales bacterium]|nr:DUF4465 domain-containing protein [Pirellulales bacterium]
MPTFHAGNLIPHVRHSLYSKNHPPTLKEIIMKKNAFIQSCLTCLFPAIALLIMPNTGSAITVDFEDLPSAASPLTIGDPGSEWHGEDIFDYNPPNYTHTATESSFTSNGITFDNMRDYYMTEWYGYEYEVDYWDGWAYSNRCDTTSTALAGQFTAMGSGVVGENGALDSAQYGVVAVSASYSTLQFDMDRSLESAYFTNNAYAHDSMLNGDTFAKKFGGTTGDDLDWFLLTITGKDAGGQTTGTAEFYLADFRFANNAEDYIVNSWTLKDLSGLGDNVRSIEFSLSSSDSGTFGMNTPAYFAIDNIEFAPIPADANDDGVVD